MSTHLCNKIGNIFAFSKHILWLHRFQPLRQPRYTAACHSASRNGKSYSDSDTFHKYKTVMDAPEGVFQGVIDRFNGITVNSNEEFGAKEDFGQKLEKSIAHWISSKRRAIWFKVQTNHAEWVPHLVKNGFEFHHAKRGFVLLYRWLPEDEYINLPHYAHTMLGVGGLVINDNNEVLVVSDRYALIPNSWKLPGGYVEPNENLVDAAIREVHEETGVKAEFKTVVSSRHSHGGSFHCSDLYVVVGLTPITMELKPCQREVIKCAWLPVSEYLDHPNVHETNRHFVRTFLDYKKRGIIMTCETATHQILKKEYCLYYMKASENGNEAPTNTAT